MLCVDLGESFPTNIWLQKSASIHPRKSRDSPLKLRADLSKCAEATVLAQDLILRFSTPRSVQGFAGPSFREWTPRSDEEIKAVLDRLQNDLPFTGKDVIKSAIGMQVFSAFLGFLRGQREITF